MSYTLKFKSIKFDTVGLNRVSGVIGLIMPNNSNVDFIILNADLDLYVRDTKVLNLKDNKPRLILAKQDNLLEYDFDSKPNIALSLPVLMALASKEVGKYSIRGKMSIQKNGLVKELEIFETL